MLLAIETTDRGGSVALSRGDRMVELQYEESKRNHSRRLMPLVDSILDKHSVSYGEIDRLAVATGPGSFTGIRLGVTTAKSLALACEAELVAVSNLRLQVEFARGRDGVVESIIDARRGELYRQRFRTAGEEVAAENDPHLVTPANLKEELEGQEDILLICRDRSWQPQPDSWPEGVSFYPSSLFRPLAAALVSYAREVEETVPPEQAKPLYVRRSDAQRAGG